jgi:hypothetical protein
MSAAKKDIMLSIRVITKILLFIVLSLYPKRAKDY